MPSWKKVIVSGSDASLNSLNVINGVTGSLLGTASFATSASFAPTATNVFLQGGNSFGTTALLGTNDVQNLAFETSGSVRMLISGSTGRVGIGTSTPDSALHVVVSGSSGVQTTVVTLASNTARPLLQFSEAFAGGINSGMSIEYDGRGTGGDNKMYINDIVGSPVFTVLSGGSVGIGTITPASTLHVNGNTTIGYSTATAAPSNGLLVQGSVGIGTTAPASLLHVNGTVSGSSFQAYGTGRAFFTQNTTTNAVWSEFINTGGNFYVGRENSAGSSFGAAAYSAVLYESGVNPMVFFTSGSARMTISGSTGNIGIGTAVPLLARLQIQGNVSASSYTGSLFGTASRADNATSASYALTTTSASFSSTSVSASFATNAVSASFATQANTSFTASSADNFTVRGTLTAQTIVAQVITSSTDYVTGSTRFGSLMTNTHQFTGSVSITGSLNVVGTGITGSLLGTASRADNATSASFASTAVSSSFSSTAVSSSFTTTAVSASFATQANTSFTASTADTFYARGSVGIGSASPISELNILASNPYLTLQGSNADYSNAAVQLIARGASNQRALGTFMFQSASQVEWFEGQPYGAADNWMIARRSTATSSLQSSPRGETAQTTFSLLFVSSSGNVGIGITTPKAKLVANGTTWLNLTSDYFGAGTTVQISAGGTGAVGVQANTLYFYPYSSNTTAYLSYGYNGQISWKLGNAGGHARFGLLNSGSSELVSVNYDGNVGIGTTSPSNKLDVSGSANIYNRLDVGTGLDWPAGVSNAIATFKQSSSTGGVIIQETGNASFDRVLKLNSNGDEQSIESTYRDTGPYGNLIFKTGGSERMRITSGGNVGIGVTSPVAKLHLSGSNTDAILQINSPASASILVVSGSGGVGIGNTAPYGRLEVRQALPYDGIYVTEVASSRKTIGIWHNGTDGHIETTYLGAGSYTGLSLDTYSTSRIYIAASGSVGIGTTSPVSTLHVNGVVSIGTTSVSTEGNLYLGPRGTTEGGQIFFQAGTSYTSASMLDVYNDGANPYFRILRGTNIASDAIIAQFNIHTKQFVLPAYNSTSSFAGTATAYLAVDATGSVITVAGSGGASLSGGSTNYVARWASSTTLTTGSLFDNGTNVGIGTTTPIYPFNVVIPASGSKQDLSNINRAAANFITFTNPQYSADSSIGLLFRSFPQSDSRQGAGIVVSGGSNNGATDLSIFTSTSSDGLASTSSADITILGNTKLVGIGTTNPASKLHVNGNTTIGYSTATAAPSNGLLVNGSVGIGSSSPAVKLDVQNGDFKVGSNFRIDSNGDAYQLTTGGAALWAATANTTYPTYGFYGDTGIGMYRASADTLAFATNVSERMRIDSGGNVGIGNTSPSTFNQRVTTPHVVIGTGTGSPGLTIYSSTTDQASVNFAIGTTTTQQYDGGFVYVPNSGSPYLTFHVNAGAERMRINASGSVGIGSTSPAYALDVNGTGRFTAIIETSTRTLKDNIQPYSTEIDKFKQLEPVSFTWKETGKQDVGLIAEDVEKIFPEFVSKTDDGNVQGINYGKLATIFINVLKQQQEKIELLEEQIKKLTS